MKNSAVVIEYILEILGYIEGLVLCLSLVFLPLGIYVIYGANYYLMATRLTDSEIGIVRNHLINYGIFFSIILFPIGLLSLLIVPLCASHNISVENTKNDTDENFSEKTRETTEPVETTQRVVTEEELEKLNELKKYKEQGIITEEEYEQAKQSLLE
ncbi:MAG: SHOCT domain-containing protein [Clostridia bacterium]|nr:SHOCT domain-containing protein [Clostridia bacterium]